MRYIADLHIHSLFSRATSKASHLRSLAAWAAVKGIDVVATGDFTHPGWFAHLHEELIPAEEGLFRLRPDPLYDYAALLPEGLQPGRHPEEIRFILSAEISCIYKRGGKVRKVHNLLYASGFDEVRRINSTLANLGNINADGRPILGLDSRDLLEIVLEQAADGFLVPAHIWTPWFSLFGSKSGFDRLEDCFADLSEHVFALETGLSSDPAMNRLVSALDRYTLISNSDCHSPAKLGREANIFDTGLDYFSLRQALQAPADAAGRQRFLATVEFFPEEGKYHSDGHRKCGVHLDPQQTRELKGLCPVCGKGLTVGVLNRVFELADRTEPVYPAFSPKVHSLIPLTEMVSELLGVGPAGKKVMQAYVRLIKTFGSEFGLLLDAPLEDMRSRGLTLLAEAIERVRSGKVIREPGSDGVYGVIRVFSEGERAQLIGQQSLFPQAEATKPRARKAQSAPLVKNAAATAACPTLPTAADLQTAEPMPATGRLNEAQLAAVMSTAPVIAVQAGPGTGKTHTLVSRVKRMLEEGRSPCTVITFTNKAADELRRRLYLQPGHQEVCRIATFHGFCLQLLRTRQPDLAVAGPEERSGILSSLYPQLSRQEREQASLDISRALLNACETTLPEQARDYVDVLAQKNLIDLDAICYQALILLRRGDEWADRFRGMAGMLFVDEFQDVNAVQYGLVAALAATNPVFCIGDPDQAIYGFRGASPHWFYRLVQDLTAELHVLSQNYRNGALIVQAASAVIRHNLQSIAHAVPPAAMEAMTTIPARLHMQSCASPIEEARFIAAQVEAQTGGLSHRGLERMAAGSETNVSFGDIAVLYRNLRQSEVVQSVFAERGIPFQQVDLEAYYTRGSCRLLYNWLMLLSGRAGVEELLFLLGQESGIGEKRLAGLQTLLRQGLPSGQSNPNADSAAWFVPVLTGGPEARLSAAFVRLFFEMAGQIKTLPLYTFFDILMSGLAKYYNFDLEEAAVSRLRQNALSFTGLDSFADHLERYSDSVLYDPKAQAVTMSTLHAAKGLEFDVVFICGCEQGLLPLSPREALAGPALQEHIAEERRLFYVGMTRARTGLYCTWCKMRRNFAGIAAQGTASAERSPSSFLFEFSPELVSPLPYIEQHNKKIRPGARQLSLFPGTS
ncbi:MAG: UvrD-helicase domain-containing protein [bacterium]|nr:UvrD-helicase domain-containing protein [bacterium]